MKSCARAARAAASICCRGRLGPAVGDVVAHGGVEQQHVLRHDADLAAQAVERHGGDVDAVDRDPARAGFVQAHEEVGEGALAGAVGPDDRDGFAGGDGEIDAVARPAAGRDSRSSRPRSAMAPLTGGSVAPTCAGRLGRLVERVREPRHRARAPFASGHRRPRARRRAASAAAHRAGSSRARRDRACRR